MNEKELFTARVMRRYKLELIADGYAECPECNDDILQEELDLNEGTCADCFEMAFPYNGLRVCDER